MILGSVAPLTLLLTFSGTATAAFVTGDIFASVNNGLVTVYNPAGTLIQTLNTTLGGFTTGSAADPSGNFYVTDFSVSQVSKFNNSGVLQGTYGSGYSTPEDILFDGAGNGFVGNLNGGAGIREFNSAGTLQRVFSTPRTDWFDFNSTETIAYFTDESGAIHRWNLTTNSAMTDFAATGGNFALRLLSNGNLLVANSVNVHEFNSAGSIIQTYTISGASSLFALNLDPDGTSFWTGDINTGNLYKINITTGALEQTISTGGGGNLFGVSVFGEITQVTVPEPGSMLLMGAGLIAFGLVRFRGRRA